MIRIASDISPTASAWTFSVPKQAITCSSFSIVSTGAFSKASPIKSLICPITIVTAIPAVKPVVIVKGINLIMLPRCRSPMATRIIPASTVAIISPSIPFRATIPATIEANAAVGPAICTLLPPKKEIMKPAIIAV